METQKVLLYAGGAFLLYKLFIAPKTTALPTQTSPIYTGSLQTQAPVSNTGAALALGAGSLATALSNLLNPKTPASNASSGAAAVSQQSSVTNPVDYGNTLDDVFGTTPKLLPTPSSVTAQNSSSGYDTGLVTNTNSYIASLQSPQSFDDEDFD